MQEVFVIYCDNEVIFGDAINISTYKQKRQKKIKSVHQHHLMLLCNINQE